MATPSTPTKDPAAPGHEEPHKKVKKTAPNIRVAALNITSFMDLTFNLLLFFVLTANFASGEGVLPAMLPAGEGGIGPQVEPNPDDGVPIIITLRASGQENPIIQIEGTNAVFQDFGTLYTQLNAWRKDDANPNGTFTDKQPMTIRPDGNVPWSGVVDTFNALIRAKYKSVGFAPPSGG